MKTCYLGATDVIIIFFGLAGGCNHTQLTAAPANTSTRFPDVLQPFYHRTIVLHNLFLYYVRHGDFPEASGVTQRLEGRGAGEERGMRCSKEGKHGVKNVRRWPVTPGWG